MKLYNEGKVDDRFLGELVSMVPKLEKLQEFKYYAWSDSKTTEERRKALTDALAKYGLEKEKENEAFDHCPEENK